MNMIFGKTFDEERALYGAKDITVRRCFFNLRYPFWHDTGLKI